MKRLAYIPSNEMRLKTMKSCYYETRKLEERKFGGGKGFGLQSFPKLGQL
jgi:hypothetical protein